jgi:hypothetical protein
VELAEIQTIRTEPFQVEDFSGGITDYYLGAPANKYRKADNFILIPYGNKAKLYTRQGSSIYDSTYYQIPAGNQRIQNLKIFESKLLIHSKDKFHYVNSGWQTIQGPSSNNVFPSSATTSDIVSMAVWNRHLLVTSDAFFKPQKIYPNGSNTLVARTAGMPELASTPTVTAGAAGTGSYLYAFIYSYTYTVDTVVYEDLGPVTYTSVSSAAAPDSSAISITVIPALSNGTTHNYDTASSNLKVKIYRSVDGGDTYYYVGSVNNGTTTYSDSSSDTTIQTAGVLLYTEGGVVENEPPPLCKLVHVAGSFAYYAHIKDGTEVFKNRLMQSVAGDVDSVPGDFYVDIDDEIVGLSSAKGSPVLLCRNSVYRVDGAYDDFGRGGMFAQRLSETASCVSAQSVVQTIEGVFWAGSDGIYFTDGYSVTKLNQDYDRTYATYVASTTQQSRIQGKYDSLRRRIWWTIQSTSATDADMCYILDLNYGLSDKAPFTTASGGSNFAPTAIEFSGATMYRADKRGYTFTHSDSVYTDPKIDLSIAPSSWQTAVITYDYISAAFDFGSTYATKFVPRINTISKNETDLSLQIYSINDDSSQQYALKPIRYRGGITWGNVDVIWGDDTLIWNQTNLIDQQRRFPARTLRCEYKQCRYTNAYVAITASDTLNTTGVVDSSAKTVTLTDVTKTWPAVLVDYYISFSSDSYTRDYLITARTSDTVLTFSDATNACPNGTNSWVIRGYPRGEVLTLLAYTLDVAIFGQMQTPFKKSQTGEVGSSSL